MSKPVIAVWFSCGAASAVAAKITIEKYNNSHNISILNTPIKEEDNDNQRFRRDIEQWLNHPIETVLNPKHPESSAELVWNKRKYMEGVVGAPCTMLLKKGARQHFENNTKVDWHVLGFTADEKDRHDKFILTERENLLPILIDEGMTKQDCTDYLLDEGLKLPRVYTLRSRFGDGYPNANCIGCVKATSPTYWNHVRETFPDVFKSRSKQSREIGCRLVRSKGKRIFLDELDPDSKGRDMKTMKFSCGIFCEEFKEPNQ